MKSDTQLKVQAYLDSELSPAEARNISALIDSDPEVRSLYAELKETKEIVTANEPLVTLGETREFYWSKIQRGIASDERRTVQSPARPWWMRLVAPITGTAALFAVLLAVSNGPRTNDFVSDTGAALVSHAQADNYQHADNPAASDVSTFTFRSEGMTVVWVSSP